MRTYFREFFLGISILGFSACSMDGKNNLLRGDEQKGEQEQNKSNPVDVRDQQPSKDQKKALADEDRASLQEYLEENHPRFAQRLALADDEDELRELLEEIEEAIATIEELLEMIYEEHEQEEDDDVD